MQRQFPICDILTVITGRLVMPDGLSDAQKLMSFLTGEPVYTSQVPVMLPECQYELIRQHPFLKAVQLRDPASPEQIKQWLNEATLQFGASLTVSSIMPEETPHQGPV